MKDTDSIEITNPNILEGIKNLETPAEKPGFGELLGRTFDQEYPEISRFLMEHGSDVINTIPDLMRNGVHYAPEIFLGLTTSLSIGIICTKVLKAYNAQVFPQSELNKFVVGSDAHLKFINMRAVHNRVVLGIVLTAVTGAAFLFQNKPGVYVYITTEPEKLETLKKITNSS